MNQRSLICLPVLYLIQLSILWMSISMMWLSHAYLSETILLCTLNLFNAIWTYAPTSGMSRKAKRKAHETMRSWSLTTSKLRWSINDLARLINPCIRGWVNYFGKGYKEPVRLLLDDVNRLLVRWVRKRYKRFKHSLFQARKWLRRISERDPNLFYMWSLDVKP